MPKKDKSSVSKRPVSIVLLSILLLLITVSLFSYWGYQWVLYVLSQMFNIASESTLLDLFAGLIAMISGVVVFLGVVQLWNMRRAASPYLFLGSVGFMLKNIFDIVNFVYVLKLRQAVTLYDLKAAAGDIGYQFLELAFWVFVLWYFSREKFKEKLG